MYGNGSLRRISREAAALSAVAEREGGGGRPENPEEFGPNPIGIINFPKAFRGIQTFIPPTSDFAADRN